LIADNVSIKKFLYNILILDLYEAYCARIYSDGEVEKVFDITSSVPNKHKAGGQSQRRFERIREGCITEWFKRINEHLKEIEGKTFVGISFVYENRFKSYLSTENLNKIEKFDKIEYTGLCGIYQFKSSIERFIKLN